MIFLDWTRIYVYIFFSRLQARRSEVPYSELTGTVNALVAEIAEKNTELQRLKMLQLEQRSAREENDNEADMVQLRTQIQSLVESNDNLDQQLQRKDIYISRLEEGIRSVKEINEHGTIESDIEDIMQIQLQIQSLKQDICTKEQKIASLEQKVRELQQQCSANDDLIDMLKSEQLIMEGFEEKKEKEKKRNRKRSSTFS